MELSNRPASRRNFLKIGAALAAAPVTMSAAAKLAFAQSPLRVGMLRAPAAGVIEIGRTIGAYEAEGVDFEPVLFDAAAGPKIIQALGGDSIDLSFVNTTAALLALAGGAVPLKLISVPTDPSKLFAVIGKSEIESVEALRGKKVAATEGTALHYFLARVLAKHGMSLSDIDFVNLPAPQGQAAFVAGQVDAVVPSVNGRFYLMNTDKTAREVFTHKDFGVEPNPQSFINYDLFVTTEKALDAQRDNLRKFLAAYHGKAVPYLKDAGTRDMAIASITEYVNTAQKNPTDPAIMTQMIDNSGFYDSGEIKQVMTSPDLREAMEYQVKFFMDLGKISSAPDLDRALVTDLV